MRRVALGDLLLAFAIADGLLAGGVLWSTPQRWLAPIPIVAAVAAIVFDRKGRRPQAIAILVAGALVVPQAALIAGRPPQAPVQDGALITDAAAGRLLLGLDPYGHDYIDDPALRAFWLPELPVNPLLGHYPYPPGMILLAAPLHAAGVSVVWLWPAAAVALALAGWYAARAAGATAAAVSPLLLLDTLYLFNDLFALTASLLAVGLLRRRRPLAAGLALAAALCLKQTALVFVPPLLLLAYRIDGRSLARFSAAALAGALVLVLPFFVWSPAGFLADTARYFYGAGMDSFPIRGWGLPGLLLAAGVLTSRWATYSAVIQAVVGVAVFVAGWRRLAARFSWPGFWMWGAAIAATLFLLGRTLAPNYVTMIAILLLLAWASALEDRVPAPPGVPGDEYRPTGEAGVEAVTG